MAGKLIDLTCTDTHHCGNRKNLKCDVRDSVIVCET